MRVMSDGRVRRTESEWRAFVARFESSGQSELGFCQKAKLSRKSLREWRKRLNEGEGKSRVRATRKPRQAPAGFVEWVAPRTSPAPIGVEPRREGVEFELALPGGIVLRWRA